MTKLKNIKFWGISQAYKYKYDYNLFESILNKRLCLPSLLQDFY